ncbi:Galactose mutarotase [Catalinimonas alkaloidigena]|uniref:Galactose mutarotase n=1 Tax=Catalinimonas alkaloidigena TaxID=1075417 RepID=A0A1G9E0L8_9BACT|nr:aldose 1-epimerase family protein [Catalinimonas alkaloidigena]SDK69657.1 Galactose mutarotase [Catalinimonas alkaloidigena]
MPTLQNDHLRLTLKPIGAEMTSLYHLAQEKEYLWQADPEVWARHAPVLFPIVGKLKGNQYQVDEQTYTLPQHGFARDLPFELIKQSPQQALFRLESDSTTREKYPFEFRLDIGYALRGSAVRVSYTVANQGDETMYFSIGAHPGFAICLFPDEQLDDYYLEFDHAERAARALLEGGLFNSATRPVLTGTPTLPLDAHSFDEDAIVFKQLKSQKVSLKSRKSDYRVKVCYAGFPYLGIWSKAGAPFVCIEPWYGLADATDATGQLSAKEGILSLGSGKTFQCHFDIYVGPSVK